MFCKNCGNAIDEGAAFCPKCGTATQENAAPAAAPAAPAAPAKKKKKKWLIIAAVVVLLFAILGGGSSSSSSGGSSSKGKEEKKLVGTWSLIGAISDGDTISSTNGKLVINSDGTATMTVVGETVNFSKIEYYKTDEDGDKFFYLYSGSQKVTGLFYVSSSGRDTFMIALDSDFAVVFVR